MKKIFFIFMMLLSVLFMWAVAFSIKNYQENFMAQCDHVKVQEILARHNKNTQVLLTNGKTMFINRTQMNVGDSVDYCVKD